MVRLRGDAAQAEEFLMCRFNSKMVRLRDRRHRRRRIARTRFNSKMVRLRAARRTALLPRFAAFQFQNGPIARKLRLGAGGVCTVSIPKWSDYERDAPPGCPAPCAFQFQNGPIASGDHPRVWSHRQRQFQFQNGPIASFRPGLRLPQIDRFQFQNGPIASRRPTMRPPFSSSFNSKMVRLRVQKRQSWQRAPIVSIPKWSDCEPNSPPLKTDHRQFQFQNGPIASVGGAYHARFNSKMVRLRV